MRILQQRVPEALNTQVTRELAALRLAAGARLSGQHAMGEQPAADLLHLQSELEVHQLELEMQHEQHQEQNEQLQQAQVEIQAGLERYTELFEFAPVGYLNLTEDGTVNLVNLFGAQLLGLKREQLLDRRLGLFIPEVERAAFSQFMYQVFATGTRQACELSLLVLGAPNRTIQITAVRSAPAQECRAVFTDITDRKQVEQKVHEQLQELLRWQSVMLAREERVQQMKAEVNELLAQQGLPARYPSQVKS